MVLELKLSLPAEEASPHVKREDGIVYLPLEIRNAPLPARFEAPIVGPEADADPPWSTIVFGLETDRFGMRARFLTGLRGVERDEARLQRFGDLLEAAFLDVYGGRGQTHHTPGFHAWLISAIRAESSPTLRGTLARGLKRCSLPEARSILEAEGVEADEVPSRTEPPGADLAALLRAPETSFHELSQLARAAPELADAERAFTDFLREFLDDDSFESAFEEDPIWRVECALRGLAALHRTAAAALAGQLKELLSEDGDDALRQLVSSLERFPNQGDLDAELARHGVQRAPTPGPALDLVDALRVVRLDAETGHVPAAHPDLLYWLAELAGHEGAFFDQDVRWQGDEDDGELAEGLCYTLRAFHRGEALSGPAQNAGDFYDVEACVGFVNSLLRHTGSDWRVAMIGPPDQFVQLAAAPESALRAWRADGLLRFTIDFD